MHASINHYADAVLQNIREHSGKNILKDFDGAAVLNERAQFMHLAKPTQTSANGSCHLLETQDARWIALNLARASDRELLPALFQSPQSITDMEQIRAQVKNSHASSLVMQGRMLGLAIAEAVMINEPVAEKKNGVDIICRGETVSARREPPLVIDLSSLWAGPLCGRLLQQSGARVIKIESVQRPDGAGLNSQPGGRAFYERLNDGKEIMSLDFKNPNDLAKLKLHIEQADIVIESSRPRALQQLGIDAERIVQYAAGKIWVSITGYGRREPQANWIAFGDDAAVSAGLFDRRGDGKPVFIGDAIADPLTGLHAARAALAFYQQGQSVLLDIHLHGVAKFCASDIFDQRRQDFSIAGKR